MRKPVERLLALTTLLAAGCVGAEPAPEESAATDVGAALAAEPAPVAVPGGDAEIGQVLSQQYCATCHVVGPELHFKQEPPSFAAIALYRTDRGIRNRILAPHISMPTLGSVLSGAQLDDLVAYIRSLDSEPR